MQGKLNVYERVTTKIVADLEKGVRPWVKPWSADRLAGRVRRPERHNGEPYHGINVLTLWIEAVDKGLASPRWLIYKRRCQLNPLRNQYLQQASHVFNGLRDRRPDQFNLRLLNLTVPPGVQRRQLPPQTFHNAPKSCGTAGRHPDHDRARRRSRNRRDPRRLIATRSKSPNAKGGQLAPLRVRARARHP